MAGRRSIGNTFTVSTIDEPISVEAQYSPDKVVIHTVFQSGDIYMRTRETDGVWSDWQKIVGESGGETDYTFGISDQKTTASATTAPTLKPNTSWSDVPVQTEAQYPYLWSKVQKKDGDGNNVGAARYIRLTGEDGDDGVTYQIESTIGSVTIAADATTGTLSNAVISFYKKIGENQRQAYQCYCSIFQKKGSTYTNIRQYTSKSASVTYTHSTPALTVDNFDAIVVCIYDAASTSHSGYLTELEIPVRKQGDSGFNPPYYFEEWYAWSNDESTASVTTPPTIGGTWETSIPTQGSYAYLWRKSVKHIWNATTRQYSNEAAQYFRMSGTNGTSIKTKGNAIYVAINKSSFPTGTSTNDIALEEATKKPYKWNGSAWATTGMDDASDGDSYVISGACTFRGNNVEGHLISWSDEAAKWIDVGQFKGESGITYYTHVAWATNVDSSTTPITVTGFTPAKSPNDNTLVWMGVLVDTNSDQDSRNAALYTWSYIKGEGVYFADLENMMDSVACTNDGKPSSAQSVNTIVRMWKGATAVSFTIAVSKNGQAYPSSGSVITGTTCTWNNASGLITFAYAASNNVINTQDSYDITVTPNGGASTDARTVTYKVNGIRAALNGEPAEIFALVPSANEVIKRKDGTLIPDGNTYITCAVTKNRGGSQSTPAANEYVLKYSLDERAHEYAYPNAGIKVSTIQSSLTFILYNPSQSQVLDIESIPLVIDGSDGDNAPYYEEDLYGWSNVESVANVNTEPTPNNGWTKTIPSQGSYAYLWKKIIGHTWNTTTKTYSNETPQYYRLSGTNGTSIKTKGSAVYVATSESSFPTTGLSTGDIALKESSKKPFKWNGYGWSTSGVDDAVDGDSYIIERDCVFKGKQVQGHMIMWSDEANSGNGAWIDIGQFKGADGTTWYTHVAWATNVTYDSSGEVTSVTGFVPAKTASDTTHIWMGVLVDTNSGQDPQHPERYTWSNTKGDAGESSTSYIIRGGYDTITIPSDQTSTTISATYSFFQKTGTQNETSLNAYWSVYFVVNGSYSINSYGSGTSCTFSNKVISSSVSEVCIFLFPTSYAGGNPQNEKYYTMKSIKVVKNGDNGDSAPSATMNANQWVIRFYGSGKLVSEVSRTFLFYLKVGTNDATVTSVTASSLPTGVTITSPTLAYAKQVNVSNTATPDGILNGITFTVTGTYNDKTYSAPVTLALVPSVKGNTGRFYYYAGVYDNTNDDDENKFPISDAQAPYFKTTETTYHVFDPDQNPASGYMTMKEMWDATEGNPKSFNNDPWKQMWSEFKYIITEAIFGQYAQFGSAIINGDWQLCTSGTVDGVEKSGTTDYTRFDPQFPLGTGKIDFLGGEPIEILSQSSVYARMTEICEINVIAGCTYCLNLVGAKLTQETGTVYIYVCKYIDGVYSSIKSVYNSSTSASASARLAKITDFYFTPNNYGTIKIVGYVTNSWTDAEVESVTLEPSIGDSNMFVPNYALDMRTGKIYLNDAIIRGSIRAAKYEYKMFFAEDSSMSTAASASDADYVIVSTANNTTTVFESPKNYAGKVITIVNPTPRSQPYFSKIATSNGTIVPFASSTGGNADYSIGLYSTVKIWADGNRNVWRVIEQVEY